jgi:hypothetical protein
MARPPSLLRRAHRRGRVAAAAPLTDRRLRRAPRRWDRWKLKGPCMLRVARHTTTGIRCSGMIVRSLAPRWEYSILRQARNPWLGRNPANRLCVQRVMCHVFATVRRVGGTAEAPKEGVQADTRASGGRPVSCAWALGRRPRVSHAGESSSSGQGSWREEQLSPSPGATRKAQGGALGRAGVSRNSFRNLLCCAFFRCAKFRAKFDMLCISPKPKLSRNSPPWRGKDIVRDRNATEAGEKMRIRPPKSPFSLEN